MKEHSLFLNIVRGRVIKRGKTAVFPIILSKEATYHCKDGRKIQGDAVVHHEVFVTVDEERPIHITTLSEAGKALDKVMFENVILEITKGNCIFYSVEVNKNSFANALASSITTVVDEQLVLRPKNLVVNSKYKDYVYGLSGFQEIKYLTKSGIAGELTFKQLRLNVYLTDDLPLNSNEEETAAILLPRDICFLTCRNPTENDEYLYYGYKLPVTRGSTVITNKGGFKAWQNNEDGLVQLLMKTLDRERV